MAQTVKFANLNIEIRETANDVTYVFQGDVDENFRQQDVPRISKAKIYFELDAVQNFNSCGIREWIYLIKDFGNLGRLVFRGCSVTMVDQINMVPDSLAMPASNRFMRLISAPLMARLIRKLTSVLPCP